MQSNKDKNIQNKFKGLNKSNKKRKTNKKFGT